MKRLLCDPRIQACLLIAVALAYVLLRPLLPPFPHELVMRATPTAIAQFNAIPRGAATLWLDVEDDTVVSVKVGRR